MKNKVAPIKKGKSPSGVEQQDGSVKKLPQKPPAKKAVKK